MPSSSTRVVSRVVWRVWSAVQSYILGPHFQLGVQLAVAIILTSLPVFISVLRFPHACFSSVLMVICLVSMSPDGHLGTKRLAAYQLLGQAWLGAIVAGAMVSIAKPLEPVNRGAYLALLCITTCMGLGLLTSARAGPHPITLWPNITISCLNFAVVVLWAQSNPSLASVWRNDVGGMCQCGLTAAVSVMLSASLVLPSVATEEVVRLTSAAVRGAGHSLSRYLSLLLDTSTSQQQQQDHKEPADKQHSQPAQQQPLRDTAHAAAAAPAGVEQELSTAAGGPYSPAALIVTAEGSSLSHALSAGSSIVVDARESSTHARGEGGTDSSNPNSPANHRAPQVLLSPAAPPQALSAAVDSSNSSSGPVQVQLVPQGVQQVQAATAGAEGGGAAAAAAGVTEHSDSIIVFAPQHDPVQLVPWTHLTLVGTSPQQQQHLHSQQGRDMQADQQQQQQRRRHKHQRHHHQHTHMEQPSHEQQQHEHEQQQQHGLQDGVAVVGESDAHPHQHGDHHKQHHTHQHMRHMHRGQQALHHHERHHHPHALMMPTPLGPVAVLGPSVDELRRLLVAARTALGRGAYEPAWCGACAVGGRGGLGVVQPGAAASTWRELLSAAEQLVNVVSTLQDVLVYASPRLLHPATAISSSLTSFSVTASSVIGLTINSTAQLAQALLLPPTSPLLLEHRASLASSSWEDARAQLEQARAGAVQHYWSSISSNSGRLVASSKEALAVMFVWVATGGVMTAVERLDAAGSRLMRGGGGAAAATAGQPAAAAAAAAAAGVTGVGAGDMQHSEEVRPGSLAHHSLIFSRPHSTMGMVAMHLQHHHHLHHHHEHTARKQGQQQQNSGSSNRGVGLQQRLTSAVQQLLGATGRGCPSPTLPVHHHHHHHHHHGHTHRQHHHHQQQQQGMGCLSTSLAKWRASHAAQGLWLVVQNVLLLPVLTNMAGFWWGAVASCCGHRAAGAGAAAKAQPAAAAAGSPVQRRPLLYRLRHDRAGVAALKLWIGMSLFVCLVILVGENPNSSIHPTVAYAVMTVPTHGVVALVLAWHERVESTFIRVFLRIAGTAAGGTVGWAALHATRDPVLLSVIMCCVGVLLAPLASASFHFRLATALTVISMLVVVLCQFDPATGEGRATDAFYGTRIIEVTIACLWAALFNKVLLPWSSRDWALEQMSAALTNAAGVLDKTCSLQFHAAAEAVAAGSSSDSASASSDSSSTGSSGSSSSDPQAELASALLIEESALQKKLVEPVVAVQTALSLETHVWYQRSAPKTLPRALKQLVRDMLQLADRITALQIAVAALPLSHRATMQPHTYGSEDSTSSSGDSSSSDGSSSDGSSSDGSVRSASSSGSPTHTHSQQQQQQPHTTLSQELSAAQRQAVADATAALAAEASAQQSIEYVVMVLTQPLHASHQRQLALVSSVAAAVKTHVLEPSSATAQALQGLVDQLQAEATHSVSLVARLRKQLHYDVMHVQVDPPGGAVLQEGGRGQQQQQQQPADSTDQHMAGDQQQHHRQQGFQQQMHHQQHLVRHLSAAMTCDGVLPPPQDSSSEDAAGDGVGGHGSSKGGGKGSGSRGGDGGDMVHVHVSRWWWVHAGEHYCQLLAFQYAFEVVVEGVLAVAATAQQL